MTVDAVYPPPGNWRHVGVVDPCSYGRLGLVTHLRLLPRFAPEPRHVVGFASVQAALMYAPDGPSPERSLTEGRPAGPWDVLIVRLPRDPLAGLALLLQLGETGLAVMPPAPLMVLSRFPPAEVRRVLWGVGVGTGYPLMVRDDRLPVAALCPAPGTCWPVDDDALPPATGEPTRLTEKERQVLLYSVQAVSVPEQARRRDRNSKTVYGQRLSAMHKLGVATLPRLLERFRTRPALPGE